MCCYGRGLCARNRCLCDDEFSSATHCSKHAHFHLRSFLSELATVTLEIVRKNRDPNLHSKNTLYISACIGCCTIRSFVVTALLNQEFKMH